MSLNQQASLTTQNIKSQRVKRPNLILLLTGHMGNLFKEREHAGLLPQRPIKLLGQALHLLQGNRPSMVQINLPSQQITTHQTQNPARRFHPNRLVLRQPLISAPYPLSLDSYHMVCPD